MFVSFQGDSEELSYDYVKDGASRNQYIMKKEIVLLLYDF
jgi:hypothetical protein